MGPAFAIRGMKKGPTLRVRPRSESWRPNHLCLTL